VGCAERKVMVSHQRRQGGRKMRTNNSPTPVTNSSPASSWSNLRNVGTWLAS
jgi:hypothetical protein